MEYLFYVPLLSAFILSTVALNVLIIKGIIILLKHD